MIGRLRGRITKIKPGEVIIDTAGVGYYVRVSYNSFYELPEDGLEATLLIHTHVREDNIALYGFTKEIEKDLFVRLITVSGIGPRLAINILSGIPVMELITAIDRSSVDRLQAIPGVGRKTADRIAVEMRDKIKGLAGEEGDQSGFTTSGISQPQNDIISALLNLGYKRKEAELAVSVISKELNPESAFDVILKKCLTLLSGGFLK